MIADGPLKTVILKFWRERRHIKIVAHSAISKYSTFIFNNILLWESKRKILLLFEKSWEIFQSLENLLRNICHISLIYAGLSSDIFGKLRSFQERTAQFLSNMKQTQSVLVLYTTGVAGIYFLNILP